MKWTLGALDVLGSGCLLASFGFFGVDELVEHVDDVIRAFYGRLRRVVGDLLGGREARKAGVEFLGVLDLRDDDRQRVAGRGDRLDHEGDARVVAEAAFFVRLHHHVAEERARFFAAVCELAEADLALGQVFLRQLAADLVFIDFLYLHMV